MKTIIRVLFISIVLSVFMSPGVYADTGGVSVQDFSVNNGVFTTDFTVGGVAHTYTSPSNTRLLSIFFGTSAGESSSTIQSGFFAGTYPYVIPVFVAYVYNIDTGSKEIHRYSSIDDSVHILNTELYNTTRTGYLRTANGSRFIIGGNYRFNNHYIYTLHPVQLLSLSGSAFSNTSSYSDNRVVFGTSNGPLSSSYNYTGVTDVYTTEDTGVYKYIKSYNSFLSPPLSLTQSFQAPNPLGTEALPEEEIELGESIGKFQSGSGVILRANTTEENPENLELHVEVYEVPTFNLITAESSNFSATGSGKVLIPNLGAGKYYWKAKIVDENGNESEYTAFESDTFLESDFEIFEGFEPYPYGYSFPNSIPASSILTGGIEGYNFLGLIDTREKYDGTKWNIFHSLFPESIFQSESEMFALFDSLGLNEDTPQIFANGSCVGLGMSASIYHKNNTLIPELLDATGGGYIWDQIELSTSSSSSWDEFDDVLKTILTFQLSQRLQVYNTAETESQKNQSPVEILEEIRENPDTTYMLTFAGGKSNSSKIQAHAVVPYKVEDDKIYVWDNNIPFYKENYRGTDYYSYNQFIEITSNGFVSPFFEEVYQWEYFQNLALINLDELYGLSDKTAMGFNDDDILYTFSGVGDVVITDNQGRITGFQNGVIVEEIPGTQVIIPLNATLEGEESINTWKQIYVREKLNNLTIEVSGTTDESYDLMIAGGDYYTKLEGVSTTSGQIDTFTTTRNHLKINFDDKKIGNYNLLVDNFHNSGTGTVYVDSVEVISEPQQYSIDWEKVVSDTDDAVTYETDTDRDGVYDTSISVSAIIPGEELIEQEPEVSDYIYPSTTITWNSGQQRTISSHYSIVPNFDEYNWGEDIAFTTSGEGNPTVNTTSSGRQSSGVLRNGANIQMDVPPVGQSYTAYLHIGEYTFEFTTTRDLAPASDVGTLDFGTKTVNYSGTVTSNWVNFPFLYEPTEFILTGEGSPTAQTINGQRSDSGTVRWGTNIKAEIPEPGETRVIQFEILGEKGMFTIIRQ